MELRLYRRLDLGRWEWWLLQTPRRCLGHGQRGSKLAALRDGLLLAQDTDPKAEITTLVTDYRFWPAGPRTKRAAAITVYKELTRQMPWTRCKRGCGRWLLYDDECRCGNHKPIAKQREMRWGNGGWRKLTRGRNIQCPASG